MNFGAVIRALDALMLVGEAARRFKGSPSAGTETEAPLAESPSASDQVGPVEARLGNLVVAALKEAFDRDHVRLELERSHLDETRRRAENAMRNELRRQAVDREGGRLRLLAGTALVGWMASVALLTLRLDVASTASRAIVAIGWLLLLASLASALAAQRRVSAISIDGDQDGGALAPSGSASLWLLVSGLAAVAVSLLV